MSEFEFVIPLECEDLRRRSDVRQYVVDEVYPLRMIPVKLQALMSETELLRTLLDHHVLEPDVRHKHLTCVKMLVYLLTQFAGPLFQSPDKVIESAKGRNKSSRETTNEIECERVIQVVLRLMELPVHKLWNPPVLEEDFISLVTNLCYKMLENTNINRNKSCRDACVHVVGIMIRHHHHSLAASLKILQLVQHHEHLAVPLAQAVVVYATDYDTKSIVDDVIREISRLNYAEFRDTAGTHHVAVFLVEIAEKCAPILLQYMARLIPLLDEESYQMRNCILSVMSEIMVQVLGNDNMDPRQKQTRDTYLEHFEDHIHDTNAFVRCRTLHIWLYMINKKVRKHAVQVVAALVKSDPFAAKLSLEDLQANHQKELSKLREMEEDGFMTEDVEVEKVCDTDVADHPMKEEFSKQKVLVQYLQDSTAFVSQIQRATILITQLLGSKSTTDVLEAIDFFVTCYEFGLPSVLTGVKAMLNLIWSKEATVKEAVVKAYKRLYLDLKDDCPRSRASAIVKNLSSLLAGATKGYLTSMEELVRELVRTGDLTQNVIQILWEVFTMKIPSSSYEESRLALVLISMVASEEDSVVRTNIGVIVKHGLGPRAVSDLAFAKDVCVLLLKIDSTKEKCDNGEQFRLPMDQEVFCKLSALLQKGFVECMPNWIPFMEQSLHAVYKLAEHPDLFAKQIIQQLAQHILPSSRQEEGAGDVFVDCNTDGDLHKESGREIGVDTDQLSFFVSICGHVALKHLVFLDVDVFGELKRRHQIIEYKQEERRQGRKEEKMHKSVTAKGKEPDQEEDMGLGDAPNEDQEADFIRRVCEEEIVTASNLLAIVAPLIVGICSNPSQYPEVSLQTAAALALAKYMLVSSVFCEENLPLLFTILERSESCTIRANCIVALGDLTFRFPNLIEPWTPNLYACLRDETAQVRRNTVMMLTHLILNDMVKVKGQISEMAVCILDEDQRIANLTKLFFNELAAKGNAMYNIMPDAISRLSDPEKGVEEDKFREILKFLLSFIQKDRQCEGLVEKLCQRFQACRSERQYRDLAFCLSLLQYSEKGLKKLLENIALYASKLGDPDVYKSFSAVLVTARKCVKVEAKTLMEELETRIEELHCKGATEEQIAANAKKASQAARSFRRAGRGRGRSPKKLIKTGPVERPSPLLQTSRPKRSTCQEPAKQTLQLSDSDSDYQSPALKRKTPSARRNKVPLEFSSDSE